MNQCLHIHGDSVDDGELPIAGLDLLARLESRFFSFKNKQADVLTQLGVVARPAMKIRQFGVNVRLHFTSFNTFAHHPRSLRVNSIGSHGTALEYRYRRSSCPGTTTSTG